MRVRLPLLVTILGLGAAYVAYPYVTLFRLGFAIKTADAATLQTLIDWPAVREGIKEDVCDLGDTATAQKASDALPPFGASFVRGIASSTIDQDVTPQALVAATGIAPSSSDTINAKRGISVIWAFFDSPTSFIVSLQTPGQVEPIKMEMDLHDGDWRVQRVWLPRALLTNDGSRT